MTAGVTACPPGIAAEGSHALGCLLKWKRRWGVFSTISDRERLSTRLFPPLARYSAANVRKWTEPGSTGTKQATRLRLRSRGWKLGFSIPERPGAEAESATASYP